MAALPHRLRLGHVLVDAALVALAWYAAFYFRFDRLPHVQADLRDAGVFLVVPLKIAVFVALGVYLRWWRYVSLRDLVGLTRAVVLASVVVVVALVVVRPAHAPISRGLIAYDVLFTLFLLVAARAGARTLFERPRLPFLVPRGREVVVVGAGEAGRLIVNEMLRKPALGMTPILILDDDPRTRGMRLDGVRVEGGTDRLETILQTSPPDEVIIADPGADGSLRQRIVATCREHGVPVKTLPGMHELLDGDLTLLQRVRAVQVEDVLGRPPVRADLPAIGGYLAGRDVLVTGAGGSIGSELVRQIARLKPRRLVLVDHGENNLFEITQWCAERDIGSVRPVIADVKDARRMRDLLLAERPALVFHAAAYKHVPMMEANPAEALRNNALATRDLARSCQEAGVERFVLVSTDKAVDAQTVMGASKALCEWVIEAAALAEGPTRFIAVRFGNVLGSSGSVIPIFRRQIAEGGPVTVTDAEMTRYFMTIPEAAQLIVQACGVGNDGDIFVLDMGEPVRILDLAEDMVRLSGKEPGRDIEIRIVGRRPGEKLHEELFGEGEVVERTHHQKLMRARRGPIDAAWLTDLLARVEGLLDAGRDEDAVALVLEAMGHPRRGRLGATAPVPGA